MKKIKTRYLVIGNSTASVSCVEAIRRMDDEGTITIIASEKEHTYSKPLIPYFLSGSISSNRMYYRDCDYYKNNRIKAILGKEAVKINVSLSNVITSTGEEITFERLLIATGGTPILPKIPGIDSKGVFSFFTWKDAENVRNFIQKRKIDHALVVGGGLIGLKTLEALIELGIKTDLVEKAPQVLGTILDKTAADMFQKHLTDAKVDIHCYTTVQEILISNGRISGVRLENNHEIECQMMVFAIGVKPNTGLLSGSGIEIDNGIIVNSRMQTNFPHIYAAGDVTRSYDMVNGINRNIALFPSAYKQGKVAGINMAGGDMEYPGGIVMNSISICGLPFISVGNVRGNEKNLDIFSKLDEKKLIYKKIVVRKDKIVGVLFVNQVDRIGIFTGMIKSGIDISGIREILLTEGFGLLNLPKEYRKYIVSGVGIEI